MGQSDATGLVWEAGDVPASARFGDAYFSRSDGAAESRHVFVAGNDLPARLRDGVHVAELGFGTGLNLLVLWLAWRATGRPGTIRYTGFEAWPMGAGAMARALAAFPDVAAAAPPLVAQWDRGARRIDLPGLRAEVIEGDARATLPGWDGRADAWFLDGFAPARNPEMWGPDLMAAVAGHTAPGGSFATYTAAGHVRRALAAAGFAVERVPGFGAKRHMSRGILRGGAEG